MIYQNKCIILLYSKREKIMNQTKWNKRFKSRAHTRHCIHKFKIFRLIKDPTSFLMLHIIISN